MQGPNQPLLSIFIFVVLSSLLHFCRGEVGTAAKYGPPYLPTACGGNDASNFPSGSFFAAAGDGIWENGAACGRQYLVRCISATEPGTCKPDQTILVKMVDYALTTVSQPSSPGATIVLSEAAFEAIADPTADLINVEFRQV